MCESSAFLLGKNNELTRVMENVPHQTATVPDSLPSHAGGCV